jgi:hypothetical protein
VARDKRVAVRRGTDSHDEGLGAVDTLALIVPEDTHLDLALSEAEEELVVSLGGPAHAGHGAVLQELVADGLLLAPLEANLVDEDDVVGLGDGDLLVVGGEADSAHDVALVVLLGRTRCELVLALAVLVVEMYDSVSGGDCVPP